MMQEYFEKQLNSGYNGKLNELFKEWIASYPEEIRAKFCYDGLLVKFKDEVSGYDINNEWEKSERRIMFLLKDCPDGDAYDTRSLLVGYEDNEKSLTNAENTRNLKSPRKSGRGDTGFFKNIAFLLHGLYNYPTDNYYNFQEIHDNFKELKAKFIETFNNVPFAYIESKKLAGDKSCPSEVLEAALEKDHDFLSKEIEILKPNIIICCDGEGNLFNSIAENFFHGAPDDKWDGKYAGDGSKGDFNCKLSYYKKENIVLIDSFHPTSLGKEGWKIYEKVMSPFRHFIEKYGADVFKQNK